LFNSKLNGQKSELNTPFKPTVKCWGTLFLKKTARSLCSGTGRAQPYILAQLWN